MSSSKDDYPDDGSEAGRLEIDGSTIGNFERGSDLDWFAISLEAGKRYLISMKRSGDQSLPNDYEVYALALFDNNGKQVADLTSGYSEYFPVIDYGATSSGTYYIAAKSLYRWYGTGTYQLSATIRVGVDDFPDNETTTGKFNVGARTIGRSEVAGDHDWYKFHADAGIRYLFNSAGPFSETPSNYVNAGIKVRDAQGHVIDMRWSSFEPLKSGYYFLDVSSLKAGLYSVGVETFKDEFRHDNYTNGVLPPGQYLESTIDYELDVDRIKIELDGQKFYTFTVTTPLQYFYLSLFDAKEKLIESHAASTGETGLKLIVHPLVSGTYYLDARLLTQTIITPTPVPYKLSLSAGIQDDFADVPAYAAEIILGTSQKGVLEAWNDIDVFKVSLRAGVSYAFGIQSDLANLNASRFSISNIDGSQPKQLSNTNKFETVNLGTENWLAFTPANDGTYYLSIDSGIYGEHTYRIKSAELNSDTKAPVLLSQSFPTETMQVPITSKVFSFTFSEPCLFDLGNITFRDSNGKSVQLVYFESPKLDTYRIVGNKLIFTLENFLSPGDYNISLPHQAIRDLAGNQYSGSEKFSFTVNSYATNATDFDDVFSSANHVNIDGGKGFDTVVFEYSRQYYSMSKQGQSIQVNESHSDNVDTLNNVEKIQFSNCSVNLDIIKKSSTIPQDDLRSLVELYIAFFNRVPDADGLSYWIDQRNLGASFNRIADDFYTAALYFSDSTGYSENMSNAEFVRGIYGNVLGRKGDMSPPDQDVNYWASQLQSHNMTRGELVMTMLQSAHSFSGDKSWGWVANLLDNKIAVAYEFAIRQGLTFNSPEQNIVKCAAIAQAVTPTSIEEAIRLIGINDAGWL